MTNFDVIKTLHPRQFSLVLPFILEFRKLNGHLGLSNWLESDIDKKFWFEEQEILQLKREDYEPKLKLPKSYVIKVDEACAKCGSFTMELRYKKPHIGMYCKCCGSYIKWLSKTEKDKYNVTTIDDYIDDVIQNALDILDKSYDELRDDEVPF